MVEIKVRCPSCSGVGTIDVQEKVILESKRGIYAINIAKNLICEHSFIAYIDKNLSVRDCFLTDFKLETPEMELEQKIGDKKIPKDDVIDLYLITINLNALLLSFIIRICFYKKKLLILNIPDQLQLHLNNFLKFIFQNTFEFDLSFETSENYQKDQKRYKDYIILRGNEVINDRSKILDPKKINLERTIIQKFLAEKEPKTSLILLRNEIKKVYHLSKEIMALNNNIRKNEELTSKKIIDYFKESKNTAIQVEYLDFILDIVKNYFNIRLAMSSKTSDFLGF